MSYFYSLLLAMFLPFYQHCFSQSDVQVATGNYHVLVIKNGTLYGWGDNSEGQLGIGSKSIEYAPVQIGKSNEWKSVAAAAMHSIAIKKDGTMWGWGWGNSHELGLGQPTSRSLLPARISADTTWVHVATSADNTVAIKKDGSIWVWGNNVGAALGVGNTPNSAVYVPTRVGKDNDWSTAIAVQHIIFGIKKNGTLWSWGRKGNSDVRGYNTVQQVTTSPTQIGVETDWSKLFVQRQHGRAAVIGMKKNGSISVWGHNANGKLSLDDDQHRQEPTPLAAKGPWLSFAVGPEYMLAVHQDGSLWHSGSYLQWTDAKAGQQNRSKTLSKLNLPGTWREAHFLQQSGVVLVDEKGDIYTYGINARGELGSGSKGGSWKPGLVKL